MSPVSRRILLYWLLLLVPTIVVGFGGVQLLRREQARLTEQETYASESRRAAITARGGLILENLELLVGDVQTGLLDALAAMPPSDLADELKRWNRENPLVRVAFRARPDGTLLEVADSGAGDEAAGFRRRVGAFWSATLPWRAAAADAKAEADQRAVEERSRKEEYAARLAATANVAKLQSARRDAQTVSRSAQAAESALADGFHTEAPMKKVDARETRRGWTPWTRDGRTHVLGWVERGDEVIGCELEMSALVARLGGALPSEMAAGEGYAVLDTHGRVMHQVGLIPRDGSPSVTLPVTVTALEGWRVTGYQSVSGAKSSSVSFVFLGSVLIGILLVAIVAGGSLLFWQARRSEAEAAQKTSFVANVSHEFKTPLTTIRLYAELLENGRVAEPERRNEYLRTIGRETQRLARLVGNALDFSRLEQGRKKFAREPIELTETLRRLAEMQAPRLGEAGVALHVELPSEPLEVLTDRDAVEQIVLNMLDNAAKYGASGGEVTLCASRHGVGGARVGVLDRGPGVPAAHRERVFEKFHRVDDTLTAEQSGAGLGLSIARQLARGLGGELRYEPREGGGANFILELT